MSLETCDLKLGRLDLEDDSDRAYTYMLDSLPVVGEE